METHTKFTHKELSPNFLGRIFQVKGQSKNSNITILTLSFFIFTMNSLCKYLKVDKGKLFRKDREQGYGTKNRLRRNKLSVLL